MRIVVLGAGGGVGRRAVLAAVEAGHEVVAVARTAPTVPAGGRAVAADVRDARVVREALAGAQAVLWCVGVTKSSGPEVGRASMPHVVRAAEDLGVGRLVSVSGAGVTLPGDTKGAGARFVSTLTRTFARHLVEDKQGEHDVLVASRLSWTEVRPPRMSEAPGTGSWELTDQAPGLKAAPVSKADVAAAMVQLAGSQEWDRRSPFILAGMRQTS